MTLFFIQLQEITEAYAKTETINQLIEKTQPRGFGKNMLEKSCELKNNKITFYFKNKINLKKNQIREFEFLPENKPSGFQIKKKYLSETKGFSRISHAAYGRCEQYYWNL